MKFDTKWTDIHESYTPELREWILLRSLSRVRTRTGRATVEKIFPQKVTGRYPISIERQVAFCAVPSIVNTRLNPWKGIVRKEGMDSKID